MSVAKQILRPKLEAGINASNWSPCSVYTSSLIKQTADGILLEVDEKIEKINLSGDVNSLTERVGKLEITASAITETVSAHTQSISGNTYQLGQLKVQADRIEGKVEELEDSGIAENLFPSNGWKNKDGEFVNPDDAYGYYASASTITSPVIHLNAGTYCTSNYNSIGNHFTLSGSTGTITPTITSSTTDTYESCTRYYEVFSAITESDYVFIYGSNNSNSKFYCPKLELNEVPTSYNAQSIKYSSLIEQTSKEISLKVKEEVSEDGVIEKFKETGIDITNGLIELNADNTVINGNLQLHAQDDADALTLFDENDIERTTVTSNEIGSFDEQSTDSIRTLTNQSTKNYGDSTIWDLGTQYYAANTVVTSKSIYPWAIQYVGYYYDSSKGYNVGRIINDKSNCSLTLQLVSSDATYTIPTTMDTTDYGDYALTAKANGNLTVAVAGTYTIRLTLKWANGNTTSPYGDATIMRVITFLTADSPSKTLVGADGFYGTNGVDKYMYYGTDGFRASDAYYINGQLGYQSTVGAQTAYYDSDKQAYTDEYLYWGGLTGPTHLAAFGYTYASNNHWVSSQQYGNVGFIYSNPYADLTTDILPSTDIVIVSNIDCSYKTTIDISKAEYNGHILQIRNLNGYMVNLTCGSGSKFCKLTRNYPYVETYTENFYCTRMVYVVASDSSNYTKGCWFVLDEMEY